MLTSAAPSSSARWPLARGRHHSRACTVRTHWRMPRNPFSRGEDAAAADAADAAAAPAALPRNPFFGGGHATHVDAAAADAAEAAARAAADAEAVRNALRYAQQDREERRRRDALHNHRQSPQQQQHDSNDAHADADQDPAALDFYGILGVSPFASAREIRAAYLGAVRACHPDAVRAAAAASTDDNDTDANNDLLEAEATRLSALLNEVYSVLSDARQRDHYDALVGFGAFGGGGDASSSLPAANPFSRAVAGAPPVAGSVADAVAQALAGAVGAADSTSSSSALTAHDHAIVDEISCVGCGKCVRVAPQFFEIEASKFGRARVTAQPLLGAAADVVAAGEGAACAVNVASSFSSDDDEANAAAAANAANAAENQDACARLVSAADAVDIARLACPVDAIHLVTAAQHTLLSEQMARLPRVDAFLMLRSSARPTADVFVESERLWRRRRSAAETARRMAAQGWRDAGGGGGGGGAASSASSSSSSSFADWFAGASRHVDWNPTSDGAVGSEPSSSSSSSSSPPPRDARKLAALAANAARAAASWRARERSRRRVVVAGALTDGGGDREEEGAADE